MKVRIQKLAGGGWRGKVEPWKKGKRAKRTKVLPDPEALKAAIAALIEAELAAGDA